MTTIDTTTPVAPPFRIPTQAILIHRDTLNREGRSRKEYGQLQELWDSFNQVGLIHPPSVALMADGSYVLIAGGRRTAAMLLGGLIWIPVVNFENLSLADIAEMEGEENFKRLDMDWRERVIHISRAHALKTAENAEEGNRWGVRETGALLGVSTASVSHAYQVAAYLNTGDQEIINADSLKTAYQILLSRRLTEAVRISEGFTGAATKVTGTGFIGTIDLDKLLDDEVDAAMNGEVTLTDSTEPGVLNLSDFTPKDQPQILETKTFALSKLFFIGDCLELMPQFNAESVDHIVTDIPYGIEMENLERIKNLDTVVDTHDKDQNVGMMLPFLQNSYRLLKPNGFCIFWYDLDHHEKLHRWAEEVGFKPQGWPLVWHKLHPCLNNAPTKNYTKNVEFAMVLRKGNASILTPQSSSLIAADNSAERKLYDNPFAKPALVWQFILKAIALKGQIVLDPYCGQMSSTRAAIDLGLTPMGIEIDEKHFYKGLHAVKAKLMGICNGQAVFE